MRWCCDDTAGDMAAQRCLQPLRCCCLQVCGGYADAMGRCAQLLDEHLDVDFVDINMGCPIDLICNK